MYLCGPGGLEHPSELLSQLGGSLSPHSSTVTGTENNQSLGLTKLQKLKASVSGPSSQNIALSIFGVLLSVS